METSPGDYNANTSLRVLKGLKAVRERPGMYIGDTRQDGLHHLFKEILDNALDEVMAGHCTKIAVTNNADGSLMVSDNGRGISTDAYENAGKSVLEMVFTEIVAGYNTRRDGRARISGGLHGVGAAAVNALSEWLICEVKQNGEIHQMRFERGVPTGPLAVIGNCPDAETGTKVTWLPDKSMFAAALNENGDLFFSPSRLRRRLQEVAYLNRELIATFHDEQSDTPLETFHYPNGIADYVAALNANETTLHDPIFFCRFVQNQTHIEAALQYTDADAAETIKLFVNTFEAVEGGTPVSGFKSALTKALNQHARKSGLLKTGNENLTGNEVRRGVTAVLSVRMANPHFYGATKNRITNPEMETKVFRVLHMAFGAFLDENPDAARAIIEAILSCR